jgi:hypothetical protein
MALSLASSGFTYLQESVEHQSWLARPIVAVAQPAFEEVSDLFPGSQYRGQPLFPPAKVTPAPS